MHVTHQFTFPSTYDGLLLEGRIYEPDASSLGGHKRRTLIGVIVAHPYAPLGGSYDDPVVAMIVAKVLECGIAGTFNFRLVSQLCLMDVIRFCLTISNIINQSYD